MKNPFSSKSLSQGARRRVELAVAVAQERLLAVHVEHALELIELVGDRVPFDAALEIYNRLLRLENDEARIITTRALARLGESVTDAEAWPELLADADESDRDAGDSRSFFGHLKQRLRGRVNDDLRRWLELEAARTEVAVLEAHVANALHFVEVLEPELPFHEAVRLYLDALDVRDAVADVAYYMALARLAATILPAGPDRTRVPAAILASSGQRPLRLLDRKAD